MTTRDLCTSSQFERTSVVYLNAKTIGQKYGRFKIPITIEELDKQLENCATLSKEEQKSEYATCLKYATSYTPEDVEKLCLKKPKKYEIWVTAVRSVMFYRYHLLGKAIEIINVGGKGTDLVASLPVTTFEKGMVEYWNKSTEEFINPTDEDKSAGFSIGTDGSSITFDEHTEETVHQWMVEVRKYRRKNNTVDVDKIGFVDRSEKEWHALRFGMETTAEWNDSQLYAHEVIFSKTLMNCPSKLTGGDILFFRSKNKRDRAYEWIMKDK